MFQTKKGKITALIVLIIIVIAATLCAFVLLTGCSKNPDSSNGTQAGVSGVLQNGEDVLADSSQGTVPGNIPDTFDDIPDSSMGESDPAVPSLDNASADGSGSSADESDPAVPSSDNASADGSGSSADESDPAVPSSDNASADGSGSSADESDPAVSSSDNTSGDASGASTGESDLTVPSSGNASADASGSSTDESNSAVPSSDNASGDGSGSSTNESNSAVPSSGNASGGDIIPTPTAASPTKMPTANSTPTIVPSAAKSGSNGSVSANGQLQVIGTQLSNADGSPIVLRGVSTHGIAWFPDFATRSFMQTLKEEWGATVFRIAMYSYEGNDSYINNPSWNKTKVCSLIDAAIELDMYVIVDWHILADGNPQTYQKQASEFFTYIASTYPGVPNILYEICNEPNGNVSWSGNIKPYANEIIPVIRQYSPDAVILVGTPTWSQDVDAAAADPLTFDNVMYSLHFYAGTHKEWLRSKADTALTKGLPLFVTEWGTTDASGNGSVDKSSSNEWLTYLEKNQISWCNWSLCNKSESSALLLPSASSNGTLPDSSLSESGKYIKEKMLEYSGTTPVEQKPQDSTNTSNQNTTPAPTPATTADSSVGSVTANTSGQDPSTSGNTSLTLLYYNENREDSTNTISPHFQIKNNTGNDISLDKLSILYYYTPEKDITQCFFCDYAEVNGSSYRAITSDVNGVFISGSDSCMQITFSSSVGTLAAGDTVSLQVRITNEDWSNYIQSNDVSFLPDATSYTESNQAALISK